MPQNYKWIKLSGKTNKRMLVDAEDFSYLSIFKWYISARTSPQRSVWLPGSTSLNKKTRTVSVARELMCPPKGLQVDHINRNRLDNRKNNLRIVTNTQNQQNKGLQTNNSTGYKGVVWCKARRRYRASVQANKRCIRAGDHLTKESAARAYNKLAKTIFKEFAVLNKIKRHRSKPSGILQALALLK